MNVVKQRRYALIQGPSGLDMLGYMEVPMGFTL